MALQTGIFFDLLDEQRARLADEARSSLENPQTPLSYPAEWLLDIFNGGRTDAGVRVSELTAFEVTTFLACVDLIASLTASLPMHVYERLRLPDGRTSHHVAFDHGLYDLVHLAPNLEMSTFTFVKSMMAHILAWGNGYAELQRDASNRITGMWPRNPYKTRPHRVISATRLEPVPWRPFPVTLAAGTLAYRTTDGIDVQDTSERDAESPSAGRLIPAEDMVHVPGLAFDGRVGQSVVWLARQTIGMALATEKFGAKYFANFARPGGILEAPALTAEQKEQAKRSWMEAQGGENAHRVAVMPPGFKFTPISNKPNESQMIETERALRNKICSVFHVPPRLVGDDQVKGRASAEQDAQELVQYTLMTWIVALRQEFKRKLFPSSGIGRSPKNRFYVDFDLADMLRPDAATREKFYATGRQWAFLNTNDIRGFEKLNPIEEDWADAYWMPINMTLTTTPLDPTHQDGAGNGDVPDGDDERSLQAYSGLFRDAFGRVLARKTRDSRAIASSFAAVLTAVRDASFADATRCLGIVAKPGSESDRFVAEYMCGMEKRAADWSADSVEYERARAFRAVRVAAYREAAGVKAKQEEGTDVEND